MTPDTHPYALGIDIGGSGIKGALVDVEHGRVQGEVHTIPTPPPATAEVVGEAVAQLAEMCGAGVDTPIGIGFPAPVVRGHIPYMANLSPTWVGMNAAEFFATRLGHPVSILNDADAAGLAELRYGHSIGTSATAIVLTLGTGIGSAVFTNGILLPNTELGHICLPEAVDGAETWAAPSVRTRENLSLEEWAGRFQVCLNHIETLFNPDILIFGGGISEHFEIFSKFLSTRATLAPAALRNNAGIVGAAYHAYDTHAS